MKYWTQSRFVHRKQIQMEEKRKTLLCHNFPRSPLLQDSFIYLLCFDIQTVIYTKKYLLIHLNLTWNIFRKNILLHKKVRTLQLKQNDQFKKIPRIRRFNDSIFKLNSLQYGLNWQNILMIGEFLPSFVLNIPWAIGFLFANVLEGRWWSIIEINSDES